MVDVRYVLLKQGLPVFAGAKFNITARVSGS
jgi:hypothetical protein